MTPSFRGVCAALLVVAPFGAARAQESTPPPAPATPGAATAADSPRVTETTPVDTAGTAGGTPSGTISSASASHERLPGEVEVPIAEALRSVKLFGYLKVGYQQFLPRTSDVRVGSRSGFRLLNARFGVSIEPTEKLAVVASIEGSAAQRDEVDALEGSRAIALRDAYGEWRPLKYLELRAGQFKPPFNAETLLSDGALPFVTRSIVSDGIVPPEGFDRIPGLSLERQLGLQAASARLGEGLVGFRYAVAVVNGNGQNQLNNDNRSVSPVARVALEIGDYLLVGVNAVYDEATVGDDPTVRLDEKRLSYGADVSFSARGFTFLGMALMRSTEFTTAGLDDSLAQGFLAQAHYFHAPTGVEGGVRYAMLEPSDLQDGDELNELAAMVGYHVPGLPLRVLLQYTVRGEEVEVKNNSLDLLAQVTF